MRKHPLSHALEKKGISAYRLAAMLGVTRQAVSRWVRRKSKPGRDHAAAIERITGVKVGDWS